jgi:hypothetical protein
MDSQQTSPMNQICPTAISHSSEDSHFITWTQTGLELFEDIGIALIIFSIADINR